MLAFNGFQKKAILSAMAGMLLGSTFAETQLAYAGLNQVLSGMLVAAGSPSAFADQQGEVFSGGYLSATVPDQQYNVISFAPPSISGGCGGINLFMGSFSFISAKQFEQMLEQIGEGLLTFAFYSAIKSMCPSCTTILQTLENAMQTMNNAMRNTCQLGSGIGIENLAGSLGKSAAMFQHAFSAGEGLFGSFFGASSSNQETPGDIWSKLQTKVSNTWTKIKDDYTRSYDAQTKSYKTTKTQVRTQVTKSTPMAIFTPGLGNNTWRALVHSQAQTVIGTSAYTIGLNNKTAMEVLMSIIGSTIELKPSTTGASAESSMSQGTSTSSPTAKIHPGPPVPPTLTLQQLISGNSHTHFYACGKPTGSGEYQYGIKHPGHIDVACLNLVKDSFNQINYHGVDRYVENMLFGGYTGTGTSTVLHKGFVADAMDPSVAPSTSMQDFISSSPIPLEAYADKILSDAALSSTAKQMAINELAMEARPYIIYSYAVDYGLAIQNAADLAFNRTSKVAPPAHYAETLQNLQNAIDGYQAKIMNMPEINNSILQDVLSVEQHAPVQSS